jgi:hypothetical protein
MSRLEAVEKIQGSGQQDMCKGRTISSNAGFLRRGLTPLAGNQIWMAGKRMGNYFEKNVKRMGNKVPKFRILKSGES